MLLSILPELRGKMPARADYLDGWKAGGDVVPIHRLGGAA
jgi:hypothetical protein